MIKLNDETIYNLPYVVCLPETEKELVESLEYTIGNVLLFKNSYENIDQFVNFYKKNNIKEIIFINYLLEFHEIILKLKETQKVIIKFVFTKELSALSDNNILDIFNGIMNLYESNYIDKLAFTDINLYECLKNNKNIYHILLDIPKKSIEIETPKKGIGILSNEYDSKHSYYNSLTAIKLNNMIANIENKSIYTKEFLKIFDIEYKKKNLKSIVDTSELNLYVNFTNSNYNLFFESMDKGTPCILGNQQILPKDSKLIKMLTLQSDDDVNEIKEKINEVIKNKKEILKEYNKFRKEYQNQSKELIGKFVKKDTKLNDEDKEVLLSVIVPVYNVEKYLESSLNSIIRAAIDNMEILIINDGSTDDSEKIINDYLENYPQLIRYIKQDNHGLGNVRNVGLKEAKGKYIASIDSDDTISPLFFEDAIEHMKNNIDIIIYDWLSKVEETGEEFITSAKDWCFSNMNQYKGLLYTTIMPSTCNKIIKKELLKNLAYAEKLKYEDLSTNPIILLNAKTIKYINEPYYEYMIRGNSIMRSKIGTDMIDIIKMLDERIKEHCDLSKEDYEEFIYYTYLWRIEEFIINNLYELDNKERDEYIKYVYSIIGDIIKKVYNTEYTKKTIDSFPSKIKSYIKERNKSIMDGKIGDFIEKQEKKQIFKLTAGNILYGITESGENDDDKNN